ncbi:MAG: hypothetical protein Q4P15_08370, partial [Propionibacteriaceae bacterium]|nr:hypothetical protein [Propionibacteriaceae bacterium]
MKKLVALAVAAVVALTGLAGVGSSQDAAAADVTVHTPTVDSTSYIKNPGMGWQLYIEEFDWEFIDADVFWGLVDEHAWAATTLYLRVPWSRMEPTEGNYAWNVDENYKAVVDEARERGIRLAFRIVPDSQDVHMQATPQFVFDAGATGYATASNSAFKTPFVTDAIFRTKFNAFIAAFGEQYNDSAVVDYIDANGLGWWGEMSSVRNGQTREVLEWITGEYAKAFPDVMLAMNYPSGFNKGDQDAMIEKYDLAIRRDGLGSTQWMNEAEKQEIANKFLQGTAIIGENCYQNMTLRETSCDASFKKPSMNGMLQRVVDDALKVRANTLDLRWPATDVPLWLSEEHFGVWQDFAVNGGYRLAPTRIEAPTSVVVGEQFFITQNWVNGGVGRLPNRTGGWHDKYRVSYALLDSETGEVAAQSVDLRSNPGDWIKGQNYTNQVRARFSGAPAGTYTLGYAIVDTSKGNAPAISLAVCDGIDNDCDASVEGIAVVDNPRWHELGAITVTERVAATVTASTTATATASTTATVTSSTTATETASTTATATSSTTATATVTTTATTTATATAAASTTATATSSTTATATTTATVTVTPSTTSKPTVKPTVSYPADVYNTPGFHFVNGRHWYTRCEAYSQTTRCFTDIWGTQVSKVNGTWVQKNGWVFNNLTYLPSPRSLWKG